MQMPQIRAVAQQLAATLVKEELDKARPLPPRAVRQSSKPTPLAHLKALVQAHALLKPQATASSPGAVPQVNPFQAAPQQTPQGLLALLSQKGAPPSPNGMV